jgi:selenocysteine-specific elongation factor
MKHLIIGTAGHVDHGKTSLIRMLTGIDCDTHKEEKQRGITINLGFSYLKLPAGESVGIIDVPGHKDFINTMIGGACGIDMVLLVVAADSGIMPQTVEHMNIISSLGIKRGIVALTKSDLVDEELLELAELEVADFLLDTPLKDAPIVKVSATTGMGKDALVQAVADCIVNADERPLNTVFRMYIDRIFTVKGFGSVVTGSVIGGSIQADQEVFLLPGNKQRLRVRSLERHGHAVDKVVAGDRAAINLIGLKSESYERGMLLSDKPLEGTQMIDASIRFFDADTTLSIWSNIVLISGTFNCQARMHLLDADKLTAGEEALVQIHLSKTGILMPKDNFIIRNSSGDVTLGGGFVIEPFPLHHRKRTANLIEELSRQRNNILGEHSLGELIHARLKKEFRPFLENEMAEKLNVTAEEMLKESKNQNRGFIVYPTEQGNILIHKHFDLSYRKKIHQAISDYHQRNPLSAEGLEVAELTGKLGFSKSAVGKLYLEHLLIQLLSEGVMDKYNKSWIIKGHQPNFDKQSLEEIDWLEQEILACGENKAVFAEIEEKAIKRRIQKHKLRSYMSHLAAMNKIRFFKADFIHIDLLEKYRNLLISQLKEHEKGIEIMTFKESLGSKKLRAFLFQLFEDDGLIRLEIHEDNDTKVFLNQEDIKETAYN